MNIRMTSLGLPAALLAASLFGACSNTAKGVEQDTAQNTEKAKEASQDAAAATERAAEDTKLAVERAADATKDAAASASATTEQKSKEAASTTAGALDGAAQTMQIKTALIADKSVEAIHIDVDTDGTLKIVTLKGSVPTAAQKATAERIAKEKAPDYKVVNNLVVKS